jgi:small subunit ribosomal protein S9
MEVINAIGRRKSAVARIYLKEGKGKIVINDRELANYFPLEQLQYIVLQPLNLAEVTDKYDIKVNLKGGGIKGQAEALRLAIARAMIIVKPESKDALKSHKMLTRDPREVERKKPGQPGARRRFQFSKR